MISAPTESATSRPRRVSRTTSPSRSAVHPRQAWPACPRPPPTALPVPRRQGARSTPAFIRRPKISASSASRRRRQHDAILRHPLAALDCPAHFSRSATLPRASRRAAMPRTDRARPTRASARCSDCGDRHARPREVGNLVLRVAEIPELRPCRLVQRRFQIWIEFHAALRQLDPELRVLLEGETIGRNMIRSERTASRTSPAHSGAVCPGSANIKSRFTLRKSRRAHAIISGENLFPRVLAAERIEQLRLKRSARPSRCA